jgi:peptide/nickel transport system permease protein
MTAGKEERTEFIVNSPFVILKEFRHSKGGMAGVILLLALIVMSIYAILGIPLESLKQWNNPTYWINYPKAAAPIWINNMGGLLNEKLLPPQIILHPNDASISNANISGIHTITFSYTVNFNFDSYPTDFMIPYAVRYGQTPPVLQVNISRPDGNEFSIYYSSLPSSSISSSGIVDNINEFSSRIFSTDHAINENLRNYVNLFKYPQDTSKPQTMIFSDKDVRGVLKGKYMFRETFYLFNTTDSVLLSGVVLGGQVYGVIGTDDLRRDLAVGLLWGAPLALFIGLTVSTASVLIGLIYGVIAGYKGKRTDEAMMRFNDLFYSLPALPILVILSVVIGRSIFLIAGMLVIFGWVGTAKISRSLALQIKNLQYVEAARLMGQSDINIIFKHVIPQLLPLTFASIAISVPGAILGEAAISFLGLGDPTIPTWGQILNNANSAGAALRGLWWWIIPPGLMIAVTGLAFVLIGNALDRIVNPRRMK